MKTQTHFIAKNIKTNRLVRVARYCSKGSIPVWCDQYLCEDGKNLYFMENPKSEKLLRVYKNDFFINDKDKIYFVPKNDFEKNYIICK